jgi:hypothetical protein
MELSAVFDGAYPGAMVLSSAGGDSARDLVLLRDADLKNVNPEAQKFRVYSSSRGRLLTFAKKEDLEKKIWIATGQYEGGSYGVKLQTIPEGGENERWKVRFWK